MEPPDEAARDDVRGLPPTWAKSDAQRVALLEAEVATLKARLVLVSDVVAMLTKDAK